MATAQSAGDDYAVAARHYSQGRWSLAVDELAAFLAHHPADPRADAVRFLLGESLVRLRRYEEARAQYAEFLRRAEEHAYGPRARFRLGETAFLAGDYQAAEPALLDFRQRHPDHPLNAFALTYLGEMAANGGDGGSAEQFFGEAIRDFSHSAVDRHCRFGMAGALQAQGKTAEAIRFYTFLAENEGLLSREARLQSGLLLYRSQDYQRADEMLRPLEDEPHGDALQVEAGYWRGMCQLARHEWAAASELLDRAAGDAEGHRLADAIEFARAEAARQDGRAEAAQTHYRRLVERWPDSPWADDALQILVRLEFHQGAFENTVELADKFSSQYPASDLLAAVQHLQGRALIKLERFAPAVEVFESLCDGGDRRPHEPADEAERPADHYYLALAYLGLQQHAAALAALEQVTADPDDPQLVDGVHVARATAHMALEQYDQAVPPLRAYLDSQPDGPDSAECRAQLAIALAKTGQPAAARQVYRQLQQQHGEHPLFLATTAFLADHASDSSAGSADDSWTTSLLVVLAEESNPDEYVVPALVRLGRRQLESGQPQRAVETFTRLLERAPDRAEAVEAALLKARALEQLDRPAAALTTYRTLIDDHAGAPQTATAMLAAARLHEAGGERAAAVELLENLIQQHPRFAQRDAALYQLAWLLSDLERAEPSAAAFAQLADECPESPLWADAVFRLAERRAAAGDTAAAGRRIEQLLAADGPADILGHALYLQGKLAVDAERWREAIPPLARVAGEFPEHPLHAAAEFWVAEAHYQLQEYEPAAEIFDRLATATAGGQHDWLAMIPLRRAQLAAHAKDWSRAHELARGIAERFPGFHRQYEVDYLIGRCLSSQARFSAARQAFAKVVDAPAAQGSETVAIAQWMIGESFFHQKQYHAAIRAYLRVEALYDFPHWQAAALLQAGKCRELTGQPRRAAQLYAQLCADYPQTEFVAEASRRLEILPQPTTPTALHDGPSRPSRTTRNDRPPTVRTGTDENHAVHPNEAP